MQNARWIMVLVGLLSAAVLSACGSDEPGTTDNSANSDVDTDVDVGIDDVEVGQNGHDPGDGTDNFQVCEEHDDCPSNGSSCVKEVRYNRADSDGADRVAVSEIFEGVDEESGVCTRNCATDSTVCEELDGAGEEGQSQEWSCMIVAAGEAPYEVVEEEPFEVDVDFEELEEGQVFGALCLPPLGASSDRSDTFCAECDTGDDCDEGSICYNALTEEERASADELGASFCVESCEEQSDCPLGFRCHDTYCLPLQDTCSDCVDRDEDGYGTGRCGPEDDELTSFDCDDANPDAFYDAEDDDHAFPDHCYDGDDPRAIYDLNCNGELDHLEQVGTENWPEEHCSACGDACSGAVDSGQRLCMNDDGGQPHCGLECQTGYASCGDLADGCSIDIAEEESLGGEQLYRDEESPYIWYDAAEGETWATSGAEPQFFCGEQEAQAALDNPTQKRGCHPDEPGAHPDAAQTCSDIDWDCDGLDGPSDTDTVDILDGQSVEVGSACDVPEAQGSCQPGTVVCTDSGMACEPDNPEYPAAAPVCSDQDTTCDGSPDSTGDTFTLDDEDLTLVDEDGQPLATSPDVVEIGDFCQVPGQLGQCGIGEVRCGGSGLYCEQVNEPALEEVGFDGVDHSCDGADRYIDDDGEPHVIYVESGGGAALNSAMAAADDCELIVDGQNVRCDVFISDDVFSTGDPIQLVEGVHIYGGFDTTTWDPTSTSFSPPDYDSSASVSTVQVSAGYSGNVIGLVGSELQEMTVLFGVHIETGGISGRGCRSNIGGVCRNCEGLYFRQVTITAGWALSGQHGELGDDGDDAPDPGEVGGAENGFTPLDPWASDQTWSPASGGDGVFGGGDSAFELSGLGIKGYGPDGGWGGGPSSPDGDDGGHGNPQDAASTDPSTMAWNGSGIDTSCGQTPRPSDMPDTAHGSGGGGSGALSDGYTAAYAGGGGGGWAGQAGGGGQSGSHSIGMIFIDTSVFSGAPFTMESTSFVAGRGGNGGHGNTGGNGGKGGSGGAADVGDETVRGGDGGSGAGGTGGAGGHGGHSIGLLRINSSLGVNDVDASHDTPGFPGSGGERGWRGGNGNDGNWGEDGESGQGCNRAEINVSDVMSDFDIPTYFSCSN